MRLEELADRVSELGNRSTRLEMRVDALEKVQEKNERLVWRLTIFLGSIGGGSVLIIVRYVLNTVGIM